MTEQIKSNSIFYVRFHMPKENQLIWNNKLTEWITERRNGNE